MVHVKVFKCSEHGELELLNFPDEIAYCDDCEKQMTKIAEYDEDEDGSVQNMHDGTGRKATTHVEVFECSEHGEQELIDFNLEKAFCPYCGNEMKKVGEYEE
jgi:Zn finger protein HypA/HybF involved in hydrogenase expression